MVIKNPVHCMVTVGLGACVSIGLAAGAPAAVVNDASLILWLDARDTDGDGTPNAPSGTTWANKQNPGTYDATLMQQGSVSLPQWAGNGNPGGDNAYHLKFDVADAPAVGDNNGNFAVVAGSGVGSPFDDTTFTYELWVRRTGVDNSGGKVGGVLASHFSPTGNPKASVWYTNSGHDFTGTIIPPDSLYANQSAGSPNTFAFPNSSGDFNLSSGDFDHIVYTRVGNGANQSAYYHNGVLQGTFETADGGAFDADSLLTLGAERLSGLDDPVPGSQPFVRAFMDFDFGTFRYYNRPLSASEVVQNFNAEFSVFLPEPGTLTLAALGGLLLLKRRNGMTRGR